MDERCIQHFHLAKHGVGNREICRALNLICAPSCRIVLRICKHRGLLFMRTYVYCTSQLNGVGQVDPPPDATGKNEEIFTTCDFDAA